MLRLVLIYCPPVKVSPSSVLQPNILWVMQFSSLASERRYSSLTGVAAGTLTTNPFEWFFPKTGFLKCMRQGTFSWIVKSDSLHLWSFLSTKPLLLCILTCEHHDFPGLPALTSQLRSDGVFTFFFCLTWVRYSINVFLIAVKIWLYR